MGNLYTCVWPDLHDLKKKKKEDESIEGFELLNKNYLPFTVVHTFFFQHMKDSGKRLSISDSRHSKTVCMCVHMYVLHFFMGMGGEKCVPQNVSGRVGCLLPCRFQTSNQGH